MLTVADIIESRAPIFEIIEVGNGKHYKIYLDGKVEGFGDKQLKIRNLIAPLIRSLNTKVDLKNREINSLQAACSISEAFGSSHDTPE